MFRRVISLASVGIALLALTLGTAGQPIGAADHLDAPNLTSPGGDGRLDITDVYAFQHGSNTVLIMNVDPGAGVLSPTTFRSDAMYEILVDNSGSAVENIAFRVQFSDVRSDGTQHVLVREGTGAQARPGKGGAPIAKGTTGSVLSVAGGGLFFAGLKDDPFFFDLGAFLRFKQTHNPQEFCGGTGHTPSDFFKGLNVASIALEVPTQGLLGSTAPIIRVWGRTSIPDASGEFVQIDRMGKPALNTVFNPTNMKNAYNAAQPSTDLNNTYTADFPTNPIPLLGGIPVRSLLLPDELILNTSGPLVLNGIPFDGYPNGRRLADDVIDTSFVVLSNAGVLPSTLTSDCVGNDSNFSSTFPYLAAPN